MTITARRRELKYRIMIPPAKNFRMKRKTILAATRNQDRPVLYHEFFAIDS